MKAERFYLASIRNKLRSYRRFLECSGIIFVHKNLLYASPAVLEDSLGSSFEKGRISGLKNALKAQESLHWEEVSLRDGKLIFINSVRSVDRQTLRFLGKELEDAIQFAATFDTLFQAGRTISSDLRLEPLLNRIMNLSELILNVEVSSVMLVDQEKEELYWEVSRGEGSDYFRQNVRLPLGVGIAGSVARDGKPVLLNDVSSDSRWCPSFDKESGYATRSMICVPVKSSGKILGVIEVINKRKGKFTGKDLIVLECIAAYAGSAIENARIYGELDEAYEGLKALDKAREKVINHLSHEIKTPLSILLGVMEMITREVKRLRTKRLDRTIDRGRRNVNRLMDLQEKIDDILNRRVVEEQKGIISIIEKAAYLVEEMGTEHQGQRAEFLEEISGRIRSLFETEEISMEEISLREFLHGVCDDAVFLMGKRVLDIKRMLENDITVHMDRKSLQKVCSGLLKNAIENTPDQGKIEVSSWCSDDAVFIEFRDYGIGISPENQKMIFGGFFPTQATDGYASKKPYEFYAGGSGADLLRAKVFSERFGFLLSFKSTRCKFLPRETDICPGSIDSCNYVREREECFAAGGSTFLINFPLAP